MTVHAFVTTILVALPALAPYYASPTLQFLCFHFAFASMELFWLISTIRAWLTERDPALRQMLKRGAMLWVAGVACWITDYMGCEWLWEGVESARVRYLTTRVEWWPVYVVGSGQWHWIEADIGVPNPQLHAWWHIFASSGLYLMTLAAAMMRARVLGQQTRFRYKWNVIPYLELDLEADIVDKTDGAGETSATNADEDERAGKRHASTSAAASTESHTTMRKRYN